MRYEVIESKRYRNTETGRTASIYGACPWYSPESKQYWTIETVGWTVRDNNTNTVGFGRVPFKTREEAQAFAESLAKPLAEAN